jgi:hypothetical protein
VILKMGIKLDCLPQGSKSYETFTELFISSMLLLCVSHYGRGVDSASNRNEYQGYFLGGKGGRCVGLTSLPPSCADCLESGSPNLLETSGPVQAGNGIALPLLICV